MIRTSHPHRASRTLFRLTGLALLAMLLATPGLPASAATTNQEPAEKQAAEKQAAEKQAAEKQAEEKKADEKKSSEKKADEKKADEKKEPATLAVFTLAGSISESGSAEDLLFGGVGGETLHNLLTRLDKARQDEQIQGIVLLFEGASMGPAQIEELCQAIRLIREANKPVFVHADGLSMGSYTLASSASRISVVPTGDITIEGLYGEAPYLRGLLDLVGIRPDFLTCGDYKSAGEMYMRHEPSREAQENRDWLLDSTFESFVKLIAKGRGVNEKQVRRWIDDAMYTSETAEKAGLIDAVEYRQDFAAMLKEKYGEDVKFDKNFGKKKKADVDLSSPFGLLKFYADLLSPKTTTSKKSAVAIVYVDGTIMPGNGGGSGFPLSTGPTAYSTPIRQALDQAAADDSIKAVVLRVNSPGGSAVASEIILEATKRVKAKKPFVVSMGDIAGSGGYYVACGSDVIFADATTLTGSIGVVSGKLATTDMWRRFGVNWKATSRGANAGMLNSSETFTEPQRERMQAFMEDVYGVFKGHVVAIRGKQLTKEIDQLAGGRVYTGQQALELGLVDRIGGLKDALEHVAEQAKVEDYEVRILPKPKSFLESLLGDLSEDQDSNELSSLATPPSPLSAFLAGQGKAGHPLLAALEQLRQLDRQRYQAVVKAFQNLELIQHEQVILAMPPFVVR